MLFPEIYRITKEGGSICWQIWYHVKDNSIMPLDWLVYDVLKEYLADKRLALRNRINWQFGHGLHTSKRFSWRHEVILWFTKGENYHFDLDAVRIPQKYPGKKYSKGDKKWQYSWNPLGKNPSDVWDIPNVKAHHIEKTDHQCQFPVALVQRFIKTVVPEEWVVFDPFMWSGSAGVATLLEWRFFIGSEMNDQYYNIAKDRCDKTLSWEIEYREDKPIYEPMWNLSVARKPESFKY
jgi:adenine-specific DNA-methyltransferase